ncbi:MAG TPA: hypothetical protein VKF37_00605 [Chloroflexota bacterium]|nr:hypothetical protein [Chloroflexota bacterium]
MATTTKAVAATTMPSTTLSMLAEAIMPAIHHVAVIAAAHVSRHGLRARRTAQSATRRLTPTSWAAGW